jgi:hypothetical protein
MGHVTTLKSKNNQVYTVSTVYRQKMLTLKDLKEPVYVVCESAVYKGRSKPLRTLAGKKPFLIAFNIYEGLTLEIESFHELVVRILKDNNIKTPEDFIEAINDNDEEYFEAVHTKSRQLMLGFKSVDFVYIVSTSYMG